MPEAQQPESSMTLEGLADEFSSFREHARDRARRSEAEIAALKAEIDRMTDRRQG